MGGGRRDTTLDEKTCEEALAVSGRSKDVRQRRVELPAPLTLTVEDCEYATFTGKSSSSNVANFHSLLRKTWMEANGARAMHADLHEKLDVQLPTRRSESTRKR